ncbi:MAG: ThiF family adenylyltransferase [Methylophagaceae bacterium]
MRKLAEKIIVEAGKIDDSSLPINISDLSSYNAEVFSRNTGLLTLAEQEKLSSTKVAIAGMGGVGGVHLITLLRTGIGHFNISDMDSYELANMNRQYGAKISNLNQPKVDVMLKEAHEVNPYAEINTFSEGINEDNIDTFLEGVNIVVDGMDAFNITIRRLIFNTALAKGIPVITSGPIGFSSALITFMPNKMGFDDYFDIRDGMDEKEQLLRFFVGLTPKFTHLKYLNLKENAVKTRSGPSLSLACQLCSATATTEVIRIILGKKGIKAAPHYFQYDLFRRKFVKSYMPMGNKNPIQKLKIHFAQKKLASFKPNIGPEKIIAPALTTRISGDIPNEIMEYLLKAGQQAPSGENTQPWFLSSEKNTIHLQLDPTADKSLFNVKQMASGIACGAVIENIKMAASKYNLVTDIIFETMADEESLSISINLYSKKISESPRAKFIWERQTNRTKYSGKPIPWVDFERLEQAGDEIEGVSLDLYTGKDSIKTIARIVRQADRLRMEIKSVHEALMSHIHFTDESALASRSGFPIKNLEAGRDGEAFIKMTQSWKSANRMNRLGMSRIAARMANKGVKKASAIGLIRIKGQDMKAFLNGGRALENVWLEATRLGLSFQPMTVVTFLWMRHKFKQTDILSVKHQKQLESIWLDYEQIFNCDDNETHVMLFRLGYGKEMKTGTLRREIKL